MHGRARLDNFFRDNAKPLDLLEVRGINFSLAQRMSRRKRVWLLADQVYNKPIAPPKY